MAAVIWANDAHGSDVAMQARRLAEVDAAALIRDHAAQAYSEARRRGRNVLPPDETMQCRLVLAAPFERGAHRQRMRPQRSRQHQLQRRFPQRSRQQFRHLTKSRSPLGPLITLFDSGTMGMADPVVDEAVASSNPANPTARTIFNMRKPPLTRTALDDSTGQRLSFVGRCPVWGTTAAPSVFQDAV